MAISTNQKPTIYRNLYENTGPACDVLSDRRLEQDAQPMSVVCWLSFAITAQHWINVEWTWGGGGGAEATVVWFIWVACGIGTIQSLILFIAILDMMSNKNIHILCNGINILLQSNQCVLLAPAVTVGETEGAMDSASVLFFTSSFAYNFARK